MTLIFSLTLILKTDTLWSKKIKVVKYQTIGTKYSGIRAGSNENFHGIK